MVVYKAAARQIQVWRDTQHPPIQLVEIDLDRRPDLGAQFDIVRAPTLLLLNQSGDILYRQDEVVTDQIPLDLVMLEQEIQEVVNAN